MSTQTERVDAMAVLDRSVERLYYHLHRKTSANLKVVRDDLAEMIVAATWLIREGHLDGIEERARTLRGDAELSSLILSNAARYRAALARFGGDA